MPGGLDCLEPLFMDNLGNIRNRCISGAIPATIRTLFSGVVVLFVVRYGTSIPEQATGRDSLRKVPIISQKK